MHYHRWQRHGDPLSTSDFHGRTQAQRFWAKVAPAGPFDCWLWTGGKNKAGYGNFDNIRAHRFAYEQIVGEIPKGLELDHECFTEACVNPFHLDPVTGVVNMARSHARRESASRDRTGRFTTTKTRK